MNESLRLPAGIVLRDLLLTAFYRRRRILLTIAVVLCGTVGLALHIKHRYQSDSSLLVLFGPEYNFRPTAGQQLSNGNSVEYEQILRTEANLLGSSDLYRKVIETLGVATVYPALLEPPGPVSRFVTGAKKFLEESLGSETSSSAATGSTDIMNEAVNKFASDLAVGVDRRSAIIRVSFIHSDPNVAATALELLEADYLAQRSRLLSDVQVPIVRQQEQAIYSQLLQADAKLQTFKRQHDIASFDERQKILLTQQGLLEEALAKNESTVSGLRARVAEVEGQVRVAATQGGGGPPNASAPLQAVVSAYRQREKEALTTYRGSPSVDSARTEVLKSLGELGKMRSTNAFKLSQDLDNARADLTASLASAGVIKDQLRSVKAELESIDALETELAELTRARAVLDTNYRDVAKIASDRAVTESVNAQRESSVRVVEPPNVPVLPLPTRRLVVVAGLLIASVLGLFVAVVPAFMRGVYLRPEALELDTGLTVLTTVPEARALANPVLLVVPK